MKRPLPVRTFLFLALAAVGCSTQTLGDDPDATEADAFVAPTPDARPRADAPPVPDAPLPADAPPPPADAPPEPADAPPGPADARLADAQPDANTTASCTTGPAVTQVPTSTIFPFETFAGAANDFVFNSNQCSDAPDSAERIFSFEIAGAPLEWYAETRCGTSSSWDCELVLTRNGCSDADVVACETTIGDEIMTDVLQPGRYSLFVEGDNPEDPAIFDLMVNFHHTAGQAQCESTTINPINAANCEDPILDDPHYHMVVSGETTPEDVDDFFIEGIDGCDTDDAHVGGAPDKVYKLVLPAPRAVSLVLAPEGWDGMLYVTGTPCGARNQVLACSDDDVGTEEEIDLDLAAGTWYIVVDGFGEETFDGGAWGPFSLDVKVYDDACNE